MSENPFLNDDKLRQLLADVGSIQNGDEMNHWKASFLKAYKHYMDPNAILNARDADDRLLTKLQSLANVSLKVQTLTQSGHISQAQITAEGRRALNKWTEEMTIVEKEVAKFCPKTSKDVDIVGYDKYELGAILIEEGFHVYEIMLTNLDFITQLRNGPLEGLLDKNELSIMDYYGREMQSFVDVMRDLGLVNLMKRCMTVYQDETRPKRDEANDILLAPEEDEPVGADSNEKATPKADEALSTDKKSRKGTKTIKGAKSAKPTRKSKSGANEDMDEKPTPKDEEEEEPPPPPSEGDGAEGEKIIYFDPMTGTIGLLERGICMSSNVMFVKDDHGEPQHQGVIESAAEKENIVWLLKKLEKSKPKEGEWLEQIKKEKAARKSASGGAAAASPSVRVIKDTTGRASSFSAAPPANHSASKPARKSVASSSSSAHKEPPASATAPTTMGARNSLGFKNPLEMGPPPKKKSETRRSVVKDYQGIYKSSAPKPKDDGWNKVAPEEHHD